MLLALRQALLEGNEEKVLEIYLSVSKGRVVVPAYPALHASLFSMQSSNIICPYSSCFILWLIGNKILSEDLQPSMAFPIAKYSDQTPLHLAAISGDTDMYIYICVCVFIHIHMYL